MRRVNYPDLEPTGIRYLDFREARQAADILSREFDTCFGIRRDGDHWIITAERELGPNAVDFIGRFNAELEEKRLAANEARLTGNFDESSDYTPELSGRVGIWGDDVLNTDQDN